MRDPRFATPPWEPPTPPGRPAPKTLRQYFRRRDALSQHAIAKRLGCSPSYVSMVVRGERTFRGKVALKLAALTGVPVEKLIVVARKKKPKRAPRGEAAAGNSVDCGGAS
jgi:transcriptional regulator with XRE-family HTH domain